MCVSLYACMSGRRERYAPSTTAEGACGEALRACVHGGTRMYERDVHHRLSLPLKHTTATTTTRTKRRHVHTPPLPQIKLQLCGHVIHLNCDPTQATHTHTHTHTISLSRTHIM